MGHDLELNRAHIAAYANRLVPAEGLILVYPVWNEGFPAILKGFFDRVFIPGVSFTVGPDGALVTNWQKLRKILGYMVCRAWLRLSKIQRWTAGVRAGRGTSLKGTAQ